MGIRFYKLFDMLQRSGMAKGDLQKRANLSAATMAKLSKGGIVTTEIIGRICAALQCQPSDIMEYEQETAAPPAAQERS